MRRQKMSMTRLARTRPNTVAPGSRPSPETAEADRESAMAETEAHLLAEKAKREGTTLDSSALQRPPVTEADAQADLDGAHRPDNPTTPEGIAAKKAREGAQEPSEPEGGAQGDGPPEDAVTEQEASEAPAPEKAPPKRKRRKAPAKKAAEEPAAE